MTSSIPIEWVATTKYAAGALTTRAVVAGDDTDGSPLWVVRASFDNETVPGKLAVKRQQAYIPWGGKEHLMDNIEVCCAPPESISWVQCSNGNVPPQAVQGGWTASGEKLYIGRAHHAGSLTPGQIQPCSGALVISYGGEVLSFNTYEVLCSI